MLRRRLPVALAVLVVPATLLLAPIAILTGAPASASSPDLPPSARKDLVAIFGPKVKTFGLQVTRAALVSPKKRTQCARDAPGDLRRRTPRAHARVQGGGGRHHAGDAPATSPAYG